MDNIENADAVPHTGASNVANLLKRAFMFLGDGKYSEADSYAEKALDIEPENADAYLCKLLSELRLKKPENLNTCTVDFSKSANYLKAHDFGDEKRQRVLEAYLKRAAAYAAVEKGRHALDVLKDCRTTAKATERDLNCKIKKGKIKGALYIVAFAMLLVGVILFILSYTPVMEFTAAAPVLLVVGIPFCYLMFIFVSKSYYDLIVGIEADSSVILVKMIIFLVTLFGGLGVWGFVMSVKLLKHNKIDSSTSDGLKKNIEGAEKNLDKSKKNAEAEDAALREFLKHENF